MFKRLRVARAFGGGIILSLAACAELGPPGPRLAQGTFHTIVVDAGHGGQDNGAVSSRRMPNVLREKDLTLDTALRVRNELRHAGFRVVLTRLDDHFVELDDRVATANRQGAGAILVSIHYNASGDSRAQGAETYFWRADSHGLATRVERALAGRGGQRYGGVIRRRLRLTRNPDIPCILCECAYLSNPEDNRRAGNPAFRARMAAAIAAGIMEEYRLGDAGIPGVPELFAPLSKASDRYVSRTRKHGRRRHRSS